MRKITQRGLIRDVPTRWRRQYPTGVVYPSAPQKQQLLDALDLETATAAEVDAIIGNESWTRLPECQECGKENVETVEIGQPLEIESRTARVCADCLRAALKMFDEDPLCTSCSEPIRPMTLYFMTNDGPRCQSCEAKVERERDARRGWS